MKKIALVTLLFVVFAVNSYSEEVDNFRGALAIVAKAGEGMENGTLPHIREENPLVWEYLRELLINNPKLLESVWQDPVKSIVLQIAQKYGYDETSIIEIAKKAQTIISNTDEKLVRLFSKYLLKYNEYYQSQWSEDASDDMSKKKRFEADLSYEVFINYFKDVTGLDYDEKSTNRIHSPKYIWGLVFRRVSDSETQKMSWQDYIGSLSMLLNNIIGKQSSIQ